MSAAPLLNRTATADARQDCIHCGLCLGACPTYLETGNENDSPRGRLYLMHGLESGRYKPNPAVVGHLDLCLDCRACESACPSGVPYGLWLEETRERLERQRHVRGWVRGLAQRLLVNEILPFPGRLRLAMAPAQWLHRLGLGKALPGWAQETARLASQSHGSALRTGLHPAQAGPRRGTVGFLTGCVMSVVCDSTNRATVRLLNQAGYDVLIPEAQGCCGALQLHAGQMTDARRFAQRNLDAFGSLEWDAIVVNAAGCGSALKDYARLFHGDPDRAERARAFSSQVRDLSEFLASDGPFVDRLRQSRRASGPVTFHDACHLAHAQQVTRPPRDLVRAAAADAFREMPESDVCCGGAGSYFLKEPVMAARLQSRKVAQIQLSGALTVVTTNPGCLIQIQAGLGRGNNTATRVVHLADFLWDVLDPGRAVTPPGSPCEDAPSHPRPGARS
jgi:glycolate oxidase iron-sulfur subunit